MQTRPGRSVLMRRSPGGATYGLGRLRGLRIMPPRAKRSQGPPSAGERAEGGLITRCPSARNMKNQYVGDVNDYRKYGLLRVLSGEEITTSVHWMLTGDDGRTDGRRTHYLSDPDRWRPLDPPLFAIMRSLLEDEGRRNVGGVRESRAIPSCTFFEAPVPAVTSTRAHHLSQFLTEATGRALVFFDPDNGIPRQAAPSGPRASTKHLYLSEVSAAWSHGFSVLVYQHFPRRERGSFVTELVDRLRLTTGVQTVISFATSHAVFFLLAQPQHLPEFMRRQEQVRCRWWDQFKVTIHAAPSGAR